MDGQPKVQLNYIMGCFSSEAVYLDGLEIRPGLCVDQTIALVSMSGVKEFWCVFNLNH